MIKVNKNAKQNIFSFILGAIIFGGISAYAATILSSSSVSYSNTNSGLSSTNVQGAIDELYNKAKNPVTTATATKEQILSGQTAWVNGEKITGTMLNQGAKTATINPGGSYTIPAGYHNGSGKITANPNQNSGTYIYPENATGEIIDLGINNTYRYVNAANVYAKGQADGQSSVSPITLSGSYSLKGNARSGGWSRKMSISSSGTIFEATFPKHNNLTINSKSNCTITFSNHVLTIVSNASKSISQSDVPDGSISTSASVSYNITLS